ncbi:MAG: glucosamine-6-phosphate deaminase [Bacteroidales bacterium]|nr:glucosamine-6-phosphate deaminase [Bacteroidales bacterium]
MVLDSIKDRYIRRYEKIPTRIFEEGSQQASKEVAAEIAHLIKEKKLKGENCVLGLATGSSPVSVYNELVRLHQEEGLSFGNVITFNLDEYFPMQPDAVQSYHRFMYEHLFNHIDIPVENVNIPDGTISKENVFEYCISYEEKIRNLGGLDLQLLGIGRTGHIGFNEPGSDEQSITRLITLDHVTRMDAASDFYAEEFVPRNAITMGVGTIMKAKRLVLLAWGENKAPIIRQAIEGEITGSVPTTYLQNHHNTQIVLDKAAAAELTREKTPWLVDSCEWNDDRLIRKAVLWLCQKVKKPILKLTERDYNDNGMGDLLVTKGKAYSINIKVFNELQHTITGWPGGKQNADDSTRPERANPYPKRSLIFSPHPDDDAISMGGTLSRLVENGHNVHVAYQTSGNIAVFDDDAIRFMDFVRDYAGIFDSGITEADKNFDNVVHTIANKKPAEVDSLQIQSIKGAIRKGEARAACRYIGLKEENIHFMDLPFYETGAVKKNPIGEVDIQMTIDLLQEMKPHQIFAAGDLSDPHGTHRVCLDAIIEAIQRLKDEAWMKDCYIWLYRGAWQEWELEKVDMAVPISPDELLRKRRAIFKHQSQKDRPLFPGADEREFWQRADDRNRATAILYNELGMAEYEAMEVFVRYKLQTETQTINHEK